MGIVIEAGSGVSLLKKGDRVVMPFNVADGRCRNCEEGKTAFCTGVNPYIPLHQIILTHKTKLTLHSAVLQAEHTAM